MNNPDSVFVQISRGRPASETDRIAYARQAIGLASWIVTLGYLGLYIAHFLVVIPREVTVGFVIGSILVYLAGFLQAWFIRLNREPIVKP